MEKGRKRKVQEEAEIVEGSFNWEKLKNELRKMRTKSKNRGTVTRTIR